MGGRACMMKSGYEDFTSRYKILTDAEVKAEEDVNADAVAAMRGETPQPRREWGARPSTKVTGPEAPSGSGRPDKEDDQEPPFVVLGPQIVTLRYQRDLSQFDP